MRTGDQLPARTTIVDAAAMVAMSQVLRDPNPIHLDPAAVRLAGMGDRTINQGPANLAYIIDMAALALPGYRMADIDSRYLGNVHAGDVVEAGGVVADVGPGRIKVDAWLRLPDGRDAVTAHIVLIENA